MLQVPSNIKTDEITIVETNNLTEEQISLIKYLRANPVIAAKVLLGVTLEWYQAEALKDVWKKRFSIFCWSRQIGKTYLEAVLFALLACLYPDEDCVFIAPSLRQAMNPFNYIRSFYSDHVIFRSMVRGKMTKTQLEFKNNSTITPLPMGDGCVAEALVMTSNGFRYIEDLVGRATLEKLAKGDEVDIDCSLCGENGFNDVDYFFFNGKEEVYKIKTGNGYSLNASKIHPIRVIREGIIQWVRAIDIVRGDIVVIDRGIEWFSSCNDIAEEEAFAEGEAFADCNSETIPMLIMSTNKEAMASFIRGYVNKKGVVQYDHLLKGFKLVIEGKPKILEALQVILLAFGVISRLDKELSVFGEDLFDYCCSVTFKHDVYLSRVIKSVMSSSTDLPISSITSAMIFDIAVGFDLPEEYVSRWEEGLDFYQEDLEKVKKYLPASDAGILVKQLIEKRYFYDVVVSIERSEKKTYDVYIPDDHTFWSNGFISHNSKILGTHASVIGIDEYARFDKSVIDTIIMPMANRKKNKNSRGNRVSIISTPLSKNNHYYATYMMYKEEQRVNPNGDYHVSAYNFLDADNVDLSIFVNQINSMPFERFARENLARFTSHDGGFFKDELIRQSEDEIELALKGEEGAVYVAGVDPHSVNNMLGITVLKLVDNNKRTEFAFCCGIPAAEIQSPAAVGLLMRFCRLFNIVRMHMDAGGGGRELSGFLYKPDEKFKDDYEPLSRVLLPPKMEEIEWKGMRNAEDKASLADNNLEDIVLKVIPINTHNKSAMYFNTRNAMENGSLILASAKRNDLYVESEKMKGELEGLQAKTTGVSTVTLTPPKGCFDDRADSLTMAYDAYLGYLHKDVIVTAVKSVKKDINLNGWSKRGDLILPDRDNWSESRRW